MTPDVFLEVLKDSDVSIVAITDHNSASNVQAFSEALKRVDVLVVPGLEITSREEVHILGYFDSVELALEVSDVVRDHLPDLDFDPEKVGYQILVDSEGDFIGFEEKPLFMATDLSVEEVVDLIRSHGGVPVLAHVDRTFGAEYQLGFIPELKVELVEVRKRDTFERLKERYGVLTSSDAHFPGEIGSRFVLVEDENVIHSLQLKEFRNIWQV